MTAIDFFKSLEEEFIKGAPDEGVNNICKNEAELIAYAMEKWSEKNQEYTEQDIIAAARYAYDYRASTSFPEQSFNENCLGNLKQWMQINIGKCKKLNDIFNLITTNPEFESLRLLLEDDLIIVEEEWESDGEEDTSNACHENALSLGEAIECEYPELMISNYYCARNKYSVVEFKLR